MTHADKRRTRLKMAGLCMSCGKRSADGMAACAECRERQRKVHKRHREKKLLRGVCDTCGDQSDRPGKSLCTACLAKARSKNAATINLKRSSGLCVRCSSPSGENSCCQGCRDRWAAHRRNKHAEMRAIVMRSYGGKCACCGEREPLFLQLDHVNNDGNKERKSTRLDTLGMYRKAASEGFQDKYQLLCVNCNWGKHVNGGVCPHKTRY